MDNDKALANTEHRTMAVTPEALISQAIDKNVPIETLEKLLMMRRELREEEARDLYYEGLARFQKLCPVIPKSKEVMNKDGRTVRYRFAPLSAIIKIVHKKLEMCGFSYTIKTEQSEDGKWVKSICHSHHVGGHTEATEFSVPIDPDSYMNGSQKVATASSFSKRYAFCNAFGIVADDEDTDGVPPSAEPQKTGPKPKQEVVQKLDDVYAEIKKTLQEKPFSQQIRDRFSSKAEELFNEKNLNNLLALHKTVMTQATKMKEATNGK